MSDLLARLRIEADASTVAPTAARVEKALDGVRGTAQRTGAAMAGSEAGANRMAAGLDRAGDQAQRFEQRTRGAAGGVGLLTGALGAAGVGAFVNDLQKAAFAAGGLELGLGAVTGGASNAAAELAFVRQEAGRLGLVAQDTAKDFLDLAASTNSSNLAGEQTRQIWLATAEAGMALGRSPEQIGRGLTALSQIAGKGVVSMEEVRNQLAEAIPGSAALAARAMDMSSAAFNKLVETGKLTSDVFLPKFAAQLREEYGPAIDDYLTSPLGRARQEIGRAQTSLNTLRAAGGEGFLSGATEGLARLNAELGDAGTAQRAREIGEALGEGAAVAADALVAVVDHLDELAIAAQVVAGVGLVRFLMSTTAAAQQAAAAYVAKGVAARASSANAAAGLAAESVAATSLAGQIRLAAAAEVQKSEATVIAANAARAAAIAHLAESEAAVAAGASAGVLAQRQVIAAAALVAVRTASQQAAVAHVELAAAQNLQSVAATRVGATAIAARGGIGSLLGLVGGPWGVALLAAGGALWALSNAQEAAEKRSRDYEAAAKDQAAALDEIKRAGLSAEQQLALLDGTSSQAAVQAAALTGEVDKLADAHWRAAAAAKAQAIAVAEAFLVEAKGRLANAEEAVGSRRQGVQAVYQGSLGTMGVVSMPMHSADRVAQATAATPEGQEQARQRAFADEAQRQLDRIRASGLEGFVPDPITPNTVTGSGSGKGKKDKAADLAKDLADERAAVEGHTAAVIRGEHALDLWRIAQAGADAVSRAGSESVREQAEAVERLAIADERIEQAASFARAATADTEALKRRAAASMLGQAAMDELRVSEAGLAQLTAARVTSLDQLSGKEREQVELAVTAAQAKERQAIATEKAEAAGKSVQQLEEEIAAEVRRQASIGQGIAAEVAYARAEFIRQEIERAGLKVTDEAAQAIREKADALFTLQGLNDGSQRAADQERELRLMRLSNREREIAVRAETQLRLLQVKGLSLSAEELAHLADKTARLELEAEETAQAIGRITGSLRDGFIKDGKLGLDELSDYAEERLRAAVYDAFLAKPIDIVVNATVDIVNDLAKQFIGSATGSGGWFSALFGGSNAAPGIDLASLAAGGSGIPAAGASGGISSLFGSAGGMAGMAGMLGPIATAAAIAAMSSSAASGIAGALGGNAKKAEAWGWLGLVPGLIAGLTDKADRPYARADVEVQNGQFVLAGSQAKDGGDEAGIKAAGKALADQLNQLAKTFGIDLTKVENLYTTIGQTKGGNAKALGGDGFFGGGINGLDSIDGVRDMAGWTLGRGVTFSQGEDAEEITSQIIRDTILRAINAGASDLSEAEKRFVAAAESLDEAITYIQTSRGFGDSIDDMLMQLLDPAAFEKKKAMEAVEATYAALKAEAEKLIGAGLLSVETLDKIEQLKKLQLDAALQGLTGASSASPFTQARDRLQSWLDGLAVSDIAPGGAKEQRAEAKDQYDRVLALAKGGDTNALNDIATYADRLLRADRQATGSAVDRRSLYDQVTADVQALVRRAAAEEPLNAAAISGPIIAALAGSQTALAQVLMTLPPETAAPLLEGILRQPDWATRLLGENVQVPPALQELADRVEAVAPGAATPIIAAVLAQPAWTVAMNGHLAGVTPSVDLVRTALGGLPPSVTGPIIQALALTPAWGTSAVDYLKTLPPSLDLLREVTSGLPAATAQPIIDALLQDPAWATGMLDQLQAIADAGGDPPDIAGPIIRALAQTPEWGQQAVDYLKGLDPSLALLREVTAGLPANVSGPIIDALLQNPAWAQGMLDQLQAIADAGGDPPDIAGPIVHALALTPQWGQQAVDYLKGLDPSLQLLREVTSGLPTSISGPIIQALLEDPAWTSALMTDLSALLADPAWASALQEAIGTDLTLSLDELGEALGLLLALLGQGAVLPVTPPVPPVVEPPVVRPPVIGTGFGGGVMDEYGNEHSDAEWQTNWRDWDQYTRAFNDRLTSSVVSYSPAAYEISETKSPVTDALGKVFDDRISALQSTFEQQMGDLLDATVAGFEAMSGASADQLDALRETASAQRVANAHLIAKASA